VAVRCESEDEAALLERESTGRVFVGEAELARAMTRHVLDLVADERGAPHAAMQIV
jgi:CPA2 family monovalent cation:H+ antiporter-2